MKEVKPHVSSLLPPPLLLVVLHVYTVLRGAAMPHLLRHSCCCYKCWAAPAATARARPAACTASTVDGASALAATKVFLLDHSSCDQLFLVVLQLLLAMLLRLLLTLLL